MGWKNIIKKAKATKAGPREHAPRQKVDLSQLRKQRQASTEWTFSCLTQKRLAVLAAI
jgi:hypothetical protein